MTWRTQFRDRRVVDLTRGHPDKPHRLNNLDDSEPFKTRFDHLGQLNDLKDVTSRQRHAVDLQMLTPTSPTTGILTTSKLVSTAWASGVAWSAILRFKDAVDFTNGFPLKPGRCLNNLGISFRARFDRLVQLSDPEDAISRLTDTVDLTLPQA